jgi:hypothetical protein
MDDMGYETGARRTGRGLLAALSAVAGTAIVAVFALSGSAVATGVNVTGVWDSDYLCMVGCAGSDFPDTLTLKQASGSSTVTGTDDIGGTIQGAVAGNALTFKETDGSYTANFKVTISANGTTWSGTGSDSNGTSGNDTATLKGAPQGGGSAVKLAVSGEASSVSGTVSIESPGGSTFAPLTSGTSIPMGSTINATSGTVGLTVALPGGHKQTGKFYDGEFKLTQAHNGVTTETLAGASFAICSTGGTTGGTGTTGASGTTGETGSTGTTKALFARSAAAAKGKTAVRALWGNAHGKFTTAGRAGEASVLGTVWYTEDFCNGTLFIAKKDPITVTVFGHPKQKHYVAQGHSYFAALPSS